VISHYNPSDDPLAVLGVTGKMPLPDLSDWAEHTLKPQLNRIDGVASVQIAGATTREIQADCDMDRLNALGLTVHQVVQAVSAGHKNLSAGCLTIGEKRLPIRTAGNLENAPEVARQPLTITRQGSVIRVGDVARVELRDKDPQEITRLNGQPLVSVAVYRSSDADLRALWASLNDKLREIEASDRSGTNIRVIYSQAEQLEEAFARLKRIMALSAVIAGLTLFMFLGGISSTLIIMTAIPFSISVALLLMHLFKLPLDILSLSGLSLAVGIVVDSGIVVIESIARKLGKDGPRVDAIVAGTEEVGPPVLVSTITTTMVFVPLLFVSHKIQTYFVSLTWTVCLSLLASLVAALVLVPLLFRYLGTSSGKGKFDLRNLVDYARLYERALGFVVRHPGVVAVATLLFLVVAGLSATRLSYRQDWGIAEEGFRVQLVMAPGTAPANTVKEAKIAEELIAKLPGVSRVHSHVHDNQGRLMVILEKNTTSDMTAANMMEIQKVFQGRKEVQYYVVPLGQAGQSRTLTVNLFGQSLDRLTSYAHAAYKELSTVPGVQSVGIHQGNPVPEVQFVVRHDLIGSSGVRAMSLATDLRERMTGPVAARITRGETEIPVRVRMLQNPSEGLSPLQRALVRSESNQMIPFTELAQPDLRSIPSQIYRENRRRAVTLSVVFGREVDPLTLADGVRKSLAGIAMKSGYSFTLGEEIEEILKTRREMLKAAAMGVCLIYLLLVAATESFFQPLVVLTAAPFAAGGVVLSLSLLGYAVNLPVYMGMIVLCGLMANVNIVLVYAINDYLKKGASPEIAVVAGARRRLRPVLMTTVTTVCTALPMLLDRGTGSSTWGPFAVTLSSGLLASALFSLVLTPAAYLAILRFEKSVSGFVASFRSKALQK
jgi:HAE1 family hydrophobic/amphiphilic exporter-1